MYQLLKALLDPVVIVLAVLAAAYLVTRRQDLRRDSVVIAFAFGFVYLTSSGPMPEGLAYLIERESLAAASDSGGPLDVVVVLAGGVTGNRVLESDALNRQSTIRLVRAIEVFQSSGAKFLVCSGTTPNFDEAGIMAATAVRLGVPAASIRVDIRSSNTREHAIEMGRMFPGRPLRIGLVTSAYHMSRSMREFRKYFPDVVPYPTDFLYAYRRLTVSMFMPSAPRLEKLSTVLSEFVAIAWYRLRDTEPAR